ncbi:MAG: copper amine oxidase N-terminal domain-containing protein [Clostridia bacterium]
MKKKLLIAITIMSVVSWIIIPGVSADATNLTGTPTQGIVKDSESIENGDVDDKEDGDVDDKEDGDVDDKDNGDVDDKEDGDVDDKEDGDVDDKEDGNKQWEDEKNVLEAEKDEIEIQKDALEEQKDTLEAQYEDAIKSGNTELAQQLMGQIDLLKQEIESKKQLMKQKKNEMKEVIMKAYTPEELKQLEELSAKLKEANQDITVMPLDSIIADGRIIKFDTPPVIKNDRTLIPVRALSEGFGATVDWNPEEQKVTITKDATQIVLQLNNNIVNVNGVEVAIDAAPETINSRTVVPFRFIVETLGLKVNWDSETGTVEIQDGQAVNDIKSIQ